jgi:butyryl-CoA dehydrogenase
VITGAPAPAIPSWLLEPLTDQFAALRPDRPVYHWRALDAVIAQDAAGPELALHAKIFGSEMGVEVINRLMNVVGVQAYDNNFPLMAYLSEALAYPIIEGSNIGIRRRQLQDLFRTPGYNPLSASGMA